MVRVTIAAPPDLPPALVDPHALELALMNLVVNARDAMPEGGDVSIRVAEAAPPTSLDRRPHPGPDPGLDAGRYLRIAVADTGHGMDAVTLARAVEPFFSTKQPGQGTGLGLSMVHGLAHQSGGALEIDSRPGAGTACILGLPVSTMAPASIETPREAEAPRGTGRVLLVDDEALVLQGTAAMIEDLGYEVVTASSAMAALALLEAGEAPAVVVTDHAMPGMTGAVLAGRIAALRPGLPVILATGHAGPWPDGEAPPRLAKPYSLAQLAEALARAVPRRSLA
jgi:CheY-like chemotaxis protein